MERTSVCRVLRSDVCWKTCSNNTDKIVAGELGNGNRMERFCSGCTCPTTCMRLMHEQQEGVRGDSRAVILNLSGVDPIGVE